MTNLDRCYNIFDLRAAAQRRLPKGVFEYVDKGTEDGISLEENRAAFQRIKLRTGFLNDWSTRDLGTEIFGKRIELPFGIAPTGSAGLMWYQGELELARAAVDAGADGVIVSNHGGRAFDSAVATIDILPEIVEAVGDRCTVILDSGIRRGSDIVKALALGAKMVLVGRATLYGTACGGQAGAARAIKILADEMERSFGYVGARRVSEIGPHIFARRHPAM